MEIDSGLGIDYAFFLEKGHVLREIEQGKFAVEPVDDVKEWQGFFSFAVTVRTLLSRDDGVIVFQVLSKRASRYGVIDVGLGYTVDMNVDGGYQRR